MSNFELQELPVQFGYGRIETGPLKFTGDWTGVFIRGDNANGYAMFLEDILRVKDITTGPLIELLELLQSCQEKSYE